MPSFRYTAVGSDGVRKAGVIAAESREAALSSLNRASVFVIAIDILDRSTGTSPWWQRQIGSSQELPPKQLAQVARELATLISAQLPVDEALHLAASRARASMRVRRLLTDARELVIEGASMSEALAALHGAFPEYFWRLIQAGETAGQLPHVLYQLADYLQAADRKRGQLVSALLYPGFLVFTAVIALIVVMSVMVPAIHPLFSEKGASAPFIIEAMARTHRFVTTQALFLSVAAVMAVLGGAFLALWPAFSANRARLKLAIPFFGPLLAARETARFTRILALLLGSGVPMIESLRAVSGVLTNAIWRESVLGMCDFLNEGGALSEKIAESQLFPELAVRLISGGERTGRLVDQLSRVADIYEHDVEQSLDRSLTLLGPVLTVGIGIVIGGLMLSILQGVLSVNELGLR